MHHPRVDARHDEGGNPAAVDIIIGDLHIRLCDREAMARRAKAIGVFQLAPQIGVTNSFLDHVDHARDRAARRAALDADNTHVDPVAGLAEPFQRMALQEMDAQIGGDAVKTAAMHDPRAAGLCIGRMA